MTMQKKFFHFRYIFYSFLALLFGIVMARKLFAGDILSIVIVVSLFAIYGITLFACKRYKSFIIVLVFFLIGNGFYFLGNLQVSAKYYEGQNFVIGRVTDDITSYYNNSYTLTLEDVYINGESAKNIRLSIKIDDKSEINPGDKLTFTTVLENTKIFNLGSFNSYYIRNNIGYTATISTSNVQVVDNNLKFDEAFRLKVKEMLSENMSEDNAGICYAVLFGDKSGIDKEIKEYYQNSGIIHVLTVSGLHVGFLIALIYFVLRKLKLGRISTTIITSIVLLLFNILCGFAPSVMRASLMAIVMMLAKLSGREYDPLNALGLAGFIIILIKPLYAFDIGFLMSFACVATIFMLNQPLLKVFKKVMPDKIAGYLALTFSAQIGILPFTAMFLSSFNLLSFFANLIIVPIFSIVYPLLMVSILILLLIPTIGKVLLMFDLVFDFTTAVARFFSSSASQISLYAYDIVFIIFFFLIIFLISRFVMMKRPLKFVSASVMSLLLIVSVIINVVPPKNEAAVTTINDYNMEVVMLSTDSGQRALLYNEIDTDTLEDFFYNNKIGNIDYLFLKDLPSEYDLEFLNTYNVKRVLALSEEGTSLIYNVTTNTYLQAGDFTVNYVEVENVFLGFEINFNQRQIFVASFSLVSYNDIDKLNQYLYYKDFDIVYMNGYTSYKSGGRIEELTYISDGNIKLTFGENGCRVWRID